MDSLRPLRESKFRPNRSPRDPNHGGSRGRQPVDSGGRHARRALGTSNVRLLNAPVGGGAATQVAVDSDYEAPPINPFPQRRAGVSWAYGLKPPNEGEGRSSYLKGPGIGSLLLTVHSPKSPHSLSLRRHSQGSPRRRNIGIKRSDLISRGGDEMPTDDSNVAGRTALLRKKAQADIWRNRVRNALKLLHEKMAAHPSLARAFNFWDNDENGTLSREEMRRALGMMNVHLNDIEMEAIFMYFDEDQSGEVSSKEFLEAIRDHEPEHELGEGRGKLPGQGEEMSEVSSVDVLGGRSEEDVSAEKLSHAMNFLRKKFQNAKTSQLYSLLRQYDVDNDGFIDPDELRSILTMLSIPLTKAEVLVLMNTEFQTDQENRIKYDTLINRLQDEKTREWDNTFLKFERLYKERTAGRDANALQDERDRIQKRSILRIGTKDLAPRLVAVLKKNMGRIMHAFKRYDTNGDGVLDKQEFADMLSKFAVTEEGHEITRQDIDMMFYFFDKDGGGTLEMDEMVRAVFELRSASTNDNGYNTNPNQQSHGETAVQNAMGSARSITNSSWNRDKGGRTGGGSASQVTIFAPSANKLNVGVADPVNHIHSYRDRREHLKNWRPTDKEVEYIQQAVVYNPQNVGRQQNLIRRNEMRNSGRGDGRGGSSPRTHQF